MIKFNKINNDDKYKNIKLLNNKFFELQKGFIDSISVDTDEYKEHLSNAVIEMKAVELKEPTLLFGAKFPVTSTNKVTISTALILKSDNSKYKKGREVLSFYISDESLYDALINTGSVSAPCSMVSLLDKKILNTDGNNYKSSYNRIADSMVNSDSKLSARYNLVIQEIKECLESKRFSKKSVDSIKVALSSCVSNTELNNEFNLKNLNEELQRDLSSIKIEINSINEKYSCSSSLPKENNLLDFKGKESREDDNYLNLFMNEIFSEEEKVQLLEVYNELLGSKDLSESIRSDIKLAISRFRKRESPVINSSDCLININPISGDFKVFGNDEYNNKKINIRLEKGYKNNSLDLTRASLCYTSFEQICQINIIQEDFVNMMKSKVSNALIPCTIGRIANIRVPFKLQYKSKPDVLIENKMLTNKKLFIRVNNLVSEFFDLLTPTVNKKSSLLIIEKLEEISDEFESVRIKMNNESMNALADVEDSFKHEAMRSLEKTFISLPDNLKKPILSIIKK